METIRKAAGYITARIGEVPQTALVLGSGLGDFGKQLTEKTEIPYVEIPGFPASTVPGHAGKLIYGNLCGKPLLCLSGRFHFYEGYEMKEVAFYVQVLRTLGVQQLILTNAAGGIRTSFRPGDLMLITDHIKFFDTTPLRGSNVEELGPRFFDMSRAYTPELVEVARKAANETGVALREGVYAFMPGPCFETPAEIRMLRTLGADAVGMSTVPEVIAAAHCGMKVLGISCITNMAAGILNQPLSHEEVIETADNVKETFETLVKAILKQL
ncbi:MAG: purine-nucleoside phosphorylase [Clostridia bacterium]|nr:purine-nucleoside phosphorylase [Clostridia bacterium]